MKQHINAVTKQSISRIFNFFKIYYIKRALGQNPFQTFAWRK